MDAAHGQPPPDRYVIVVKGQLDPAWADWFDGVEVSALPEGLAQISACPGDQAALRGLLERIFDLNLELVAVSKAGDR